MEGHFLSIHSGIGISDYLAMCLLPLHISDPMMEKRFWSFEYVATEQIVTTSPIQGVLIYIFSLVTMIAMMMIDKCEGHEDMLKRRRLWLRG